jgi:hypothetical protein
MLNKMKIILTEDQYNELNVKTFKEFLYKFWDSEKKRGEEPTLDDIVYQMSGVKKGSEEDIRTIRPIWYDYNGGYETLYQKIEDEIEYGEFHIKGGENLDMTVFVEQVYSYGEKVDRGEVTIGVSLVGGTVNGYVYNEVLDVEEMVPNMDIQEQYGLLEYDTGDFEDFLKDECYSYFYDKLKDFALPITIDFRIK